MDEAKNLQSLYKEHYQDLLSYALAAVGIRETAEDLGQDVFHEALKKRIVENNHPSPDGWLHRALKLKVKVYLRNKARRDAYMVPDDYNWEIFHGEDNISRKMSDLYTEELLKQIKEKLSPKEYYIFQRFILENASHSEVATELGISVWACQKRLERVRAKLDKIIEK